MVSQIKLDEIVEIVDKWAAAHPIIETVYIFGSRVRQDDRPDSDLDITWDLDLSKGGSEITPFDEELQSEWSVLKALFPRITVSVHDMLDSTDEAIKAVKAAKTDKCVLQKGKVRCVITPPKPKRKI